MNKDQSLATARTVLLLMALSYCRGIETWRTTTRRRRVLLSYQGDSDRLRLILLYLKYHGLSHDIYGRGPWELGTLTSTKKERFEKVCSPCLLLFTTTDVLERVAFRSLFYCLISTPSCMELFGTVLRTVPYHLGTSGISTVQHEKVQNIFWVVAKRIFTTISTNANRYHWLNW